MDLNRMRWEFLQFSYFGITRKAGEQDETALVACIRRAYRDFCRKLRYRYSEQTLKQATAEEARAFRAAKAGFLSTAKQCEDRSGVALLRKQVKMLPKDPKAYAQWHKNVCEGLRKFAMEWRDEAGQPLFLPGGFTFGHAQKWVNMTVKYMLILDLLQEAEGLLPKLHIPLDAYILAAAAEPAEQELIPGCGVRGLGVKRPAWAWYALDVYETYCDYQSRILEATKIQGLTPTEWEAAAWPLEAALKAGSSGMED